MTSYLRNTYEGKSMTNYPKDHEWSMENIRNEKLVFANLISDEVSFSGYAVRRTRNCSEEAFGLLWTRSGRV